MLESVEHLRNATIALGTIPRDQISHYIRSIYHERKEFIIDTLIESKSFFVNDDGSLQVTAQDRIRMMGLQKIAQEYAGIESIFLRIAEGMYKGIAESSLQNHGGFDMKQISRFIILLKEMGLILQTPKRILFALFLMPNADPEFLELFSESKNAANTLQDFETYMEEAEFSKSAILGYFEQNSEGKLGSDLAKFVEQKRPKMVYGEEVVKFVLALEDQKILDRVVVERRHFCILGEGVANHIASEYKPFSSLAELPIVVNGHITDRFFVLALRKEQSLNMLIEQYLSHDYFKIASQMTKILTIIYPVGIDKRHNIQFSGFDSVPSSLSEEKAYGECVAQHVVASDQESDEVDELVEGSEKGDEYSLIQRSFEEHGMSATMQRIIRCNNVYLIIESLEVVQDSELYHLHEFEIINSGNFTVLCIKQHNHVVDDLISIGLVTRIHHSEKVFYTLSQTEPTPDMLEKVCMREDESEDGEDSDKTFNLCVNTEYYIKDNVRRIGTLMQAISLILLTEKGIERIFKAEAFNADELVEYFTIRQLMEFQETYSEVYDQELKLVVERGLLDKPINELPCSVAYQFFGTFKSFNMIIFRLNSYFRTLVSIGVLDSLTLENVVEPEIFMSLSDREKKKPAFQFIKPYVINVEEFASIIFNAESINPLLNGLNYLRLDVKSYAAEIRLDSAESPLLLMRLLRDFIQRLKIINSDVRLGMFNYFGKGLDVSYCGDHIIDANYAEIMRGFEAMRNPDTKPYFANEEFLEIKKLLNNYVIEVEQLYERKNYDLTIEHFTHNLVTSMLRSNIMRGHVVLLKKTRVYPFCLKYAEAYESKSRQKSSLDQSGGQNMEEVVRRKRSLESTKLIDTNKIKEDRPALIAAKIAPNTEGHSSEIYEAHYNGICKLKKHGKMQEKSRYDAISQMLYQHDICTVIPFRSLYQMQVLPQEVGQDVFNKVLQYYDSGAEVEDPEVMIYAAQMGILREQKVARLFREVEDTWCDVQNECEDLGELTVSEMKSLMHRIITGTAQYENGKVSAIAYAASRVQEYPSPAKLSDIPLPEPMRISPENSLFSLLEDTSRAQASEYDALLESSEREVSESFERRSKLNLADFLRAGPSFKENARQVEPEPKVETNTSQDASKIRQLYPDLQIRKITGDSRLSYFANFVGGKDENTQQDDIQSLIKLHKKGRFKSSELPPGLPSGCFYQNWDWHGMSYSSNNEGLNVPIRVIRELSTNIIRYLHIRNGTEIRDLLQSFYRLPPSCVIQSLKLLSLEQRVIFRQCTGYVRSSLRGERHELDYIVETYD